MIIDQKAKSCAIASGEKYLRFGIVLDIPTQKDYDLFNENELFLLHVDAQRRDDESRL